MKFLLSANTQHLRFALAMIVIRVLFVVVAKKEKSLCAVVEGGVLSDYR